MIAYKQIRATNCRQTSFIQDTLFCQIMSVWQGIWKIRISVMSTNSKTRSYLYALALAFEKLVYPTRQKRIQ